MKKMQSVAEKKINILTFKAALITIAISIPIIAFYFKFYSKRYSPPPFDGSSQKGEPNINEGQYGYSSINVGNAYKTSICGEPKADNDSVSLYLTNPKDNDVLIKCFIYNSNNQTLGESGLLEPNSYVEKINLIRPLNPGDNSVNIKIIAYEPQTYYSMGSVILKTAIFLK